MATKKTTKKRASKKVARQRPFKKTPVKKAAAGKRPANKPTAKKKAAKKTAPKKQPARKTPVKPPRAKKKTAKIAVASQISQPSEQHQGGALEKAVGDVAVVQEVAVAPDVTVAQDVAPQHVAVAERARSAAETDSAARETPAKPTAVPVAAVSRNAPTDSKPVIFLAFANDRDDTIGYLRNLPVEARQLRDVLEPAEHAGLCEVVVRSNCTAGEIFKVFQDPRYRNRVAILHYGGHANGYELLLESAAGQAAAADAGGLAKFLGQQQGLHLVFLNGCSTQQQTQGLLDANVSAVISTSRAIEDQVATNFSYQFYQGLAGGATIRTAYNEAEASVQTAKGGNTRGLYFGNKDDAKSKLETDRWPWSLYLRAGSETADQWNLPEAVNDPLFGLPTLPEQELPESPYRHLNWFSRQDAEVFFGRGHQIRELYDRLTAPRTAPIMLLYGQSGVGKSSILDAGLIPRLERDYEVRYLRRGTGGLLDTLQQAFAPAASDVPVETAWRAKEEQSGKPLIVFLDQVEELYTRPIADLPNELEQLLQFAKATFVQSDQRPRGKLVLGFRKEWLAELEAQLVAYELPRTKVFLEPLDRRGIIEVVQGPTRSARLREHYGLTVEAGLAEIIADDLLADRDSAIAPTLQILLTKMWTKATEANYEQPQFSQELYQQLKRDGLLLRDFLKQQIAAFRERYPEVVDSGLLLDVVALHTTPLGTADQRTVEQLQQQYSHLGETLPAILQQCQDLYLLTVAVSAQKESIKTTRLAHDTLAPLVREQFEVSDKPGQRARRILDNRAVDWAGDQKGTPLDEADLNIVEQGVVGTRGLSATEQRLVEASRKLRAQLQRTRKILKIAAGVAVIGMTLLATWAIIERGQAKTSEGKAVEAREKADSNRGFARELMTNLVPKLSREEELAAVKEQLAQSSVIFFDHFVQEHQDDAKTLAVRADAKYVIGKIHLEMRKLDAAITAFEAACVMQKGELGVKHDDYASLRIEPKNEALAKDLSFTLNALGEAHRLQGDELNIGVENKEAQKHWDEALGWYSKAVVVRKLLKESQPKHIEYHLLHASAVMNTGLAEDRMGHFGRALEKYKEADKIRRDLRADPAYESEQASIERHIAMGSHNLADTLMRQDDRVQAEKLLTKAINDLEKVSNEDYFVQAELANCYELRGQCRLEQKTGQVLDRDKLQLGKKKLAELEVAEADVAIEDYEQAKEICKKQFEKRPWDSSNQAQLAELSEVLSNLRQPKLNLNKTGDAERCTPVLGDH